MLTIISPKKRIILWLGIVLAAVAGIFGVAAALNAGGDPLAETRASLDRLNRHMEAIRPEIEDFSTLECMGTWVIFQNCLDDYAKAETAWASDDYVQAENLVQDIRTKLDRLPVGDQGPDMTILLIVGLNALAVAGVAALVITSRRRKNGV
jgi:hypothetical protein